MSENLENLILDRYQIIEEAGSGGYGTVLHAYDTRLRREVAIKTVNLSNQKNDENDGWQESVPGLDEARAAGKLNDNNIVTIYDCIVKENIAYVIEEYVEGVTLTTLLRTLDANLTLDMVTAIFKGISHALQVAHKKNLLHLDIKPDNVLIGRGGEVKVADFGLATLMDLKGEGTASAGTIGYMAPEQMNKEPLTQKSDEWSLAIVVYEMLTGSNPLSGQRNLETAKRQLKNAEFVLPSLCWETLSDGVDDVIFKALSIKPDERYETVRDFASELKPFLGNEKQGKRELATFVNGNEDSVVDTSTIVFNDDVSGAEENFYHLVDRIGRQGFKVIAKICIAILLALIVAFCLANIRLQTSDEFGLLSRFPILFYGIVGGISILGLFVPRVAMTIANASLIIMLAFNKSYIWCVVIAALTAVLLMKVKKEESVKAVFCLSTSILFGSIGLGAVGVAFAGALQDVKDAGKTSVMVIVMTACFASFGSGELWGWDAFNHAVLPASADIACQQIAQASQQMVTSIEVWITGAGWLLSAVGFSAICRFGKRATDIVGALCFSAIMLASAALPHITAGTALQLNYFISAIFASLVAILMATTSVCDRIRYPEEEW